MPFAKTDAEPVYLDADEGAAQAASEGRRSSGRTSASAAIVHPVQVSAEAAERSPTHVEHRRSDADRPGAGPRELRHLVGRGREVRGRQSRSRSRAWPRCSTSIPDRFLFGTDTVAPAESGAVFRGVRHVGAGLAAADAGGEPEGPQGQLRADLRRRRASACARGNRRTSSEATAAHRRREFA